MAHKDLAAAQPTELGALPGWIGVVAAGLEQAMLMHVSRRRWCKMRV